MPPRPPPSAAAPSSAALHASLAAIVGARHVLSGEDTEPFLTDQKGSLTGRAMAVVRPADTREVAEIVALAARTGVPIVPQGGNTGLCGGATPDSSGRAIVLSLQRLNRIRRIDLDNDSIVVEAGCLQAVVQDAAREAGRLFPLSLPSRGSCTLGGNLATNAGGVQVLRYGTTRQLTLGLEVVTPKGEIWDGLKDLRKDNTGYDLRDLYIGSEGTLGIITAASLRLFPRPQEEQTAFAALPSIEAVLGFLGLARAQLGAALTSFELVSGFSLALVAEQLPGTPLPYGGASRDAPWHVLVQVSGEAGIGTRLEALLEAGLEAGLLRDGVLARSLAQSRDLWKLREDWIGEAARRAGGSVIHDISLAVSRIPVFLAEVETRLNAEWPDSRAVLLCHVGDGNVHYNVLVPPGEARAGFSRRVRRIIHDIVASLNGSFSAEHGVGQSKTDDLLRYKSAVELRLMRAIKDALDPSGLMNPGKVLPLAPPVVALADQQAAE